MLFNAVLGHESQKKSLANSLAVKRIPHAQLFEGEDGHGLLHMALAYANAVVCGDASASASMQKAARYANIFFNFSSQSISRLTP